MACRPTPASAHSALLDLEDPVDRLRAIVRLRGAEETPYWLLIEGHVYGRGADAILQPLFKFTSLLRMQYQRIDQTRFAFQQRESAHYIDLESGEPIGEFHNPYNSVANIAVGYVSPTFKYHFDLNGTRSATGSDHHGDLPHQLTAQGEYLQTTERRFLSYPTSLDLSVFPEASRSNVRHSVDIATYRAPSVQVLDPSHEFVGAAVDFVADTEWPFWMFMGDRPGNVWWLGHGTKLRTAEELPSDLVRRVELVHPGFIADPWGLDGTPYRTDFQMLELRKKGKI